MMNYFPCSSLLGTSQYSMGYQSTRHRRVFFSQSSRHTAKSSHGHHVTSKHCTKLWVSHAKLCRRGRRGGWSEQCVKFGCPRPPRERAGGLMFFFDPSYLKILSSNFQNYFIFCSQQYGQQIVFEKISLDNHRISNFTYFWLIFLPIFNCKFN